MPLELEDLEALKEYIEEFPSIPIFYSWPESLKFSIVAGKVAWSGIIDNPREGADLEVWLIERNAKKVKGWRDLEALFDG